MTDCLLSIDDCFSAVVADSLRGSGECGRSLDDNSGWLSFSLSSPVIMILCSRRASGLTGGLLNATPAEKLSASSCGGGSTLEGNMKNGSGAAKRHYIESAPL